MFFSFCGTLLFIIHTHAQMRPPHEWINYDQVFNLNSGLRKYDFDATLISSSTPANVLWPAEKPHFIIQIVNNTDKVLKTSAKIDIVQYGTEGKPNDIWQPILFKIKDFPSIPVNLEIAANGFQNVEISPDIPADFGGYALIVDAGIYGRRLATSVIRTFPSNPKSIQYPKQSLDDIGVDFLYRIGVQSIRMGVSYIATQHRDYISELAKLREKLNEYKRKNITVLLMFGEGQTLMPLGNPRSFLDSNGVFLKTKQDYAWLPAMDNDFEKFVKDLCIEFGYPKGPVTAVSLWNEPWEGISISGWQADILRYREIYRAMANGVLEARKSGADVLVGGCDSHSNAMDKLFADGKKDFLPIFDFCSIHYEGMESPVLYKEWNERKFHKGRVKIWDTESWVGNTDDRIGLVVATNRAAGYDRSMGIYGGYMVDGDNADKIKIKSEEGPKEINKQPAAWSPAAAMGAVQHFLGEREFKEVLFKNGLPWVLLFEGESKNPDDGTIVVCGDIGEAFGPESILFRNVRGLKEQKEKEELQRKISVLPEGSTERKNLEKELKAFIPLEGGLLTIPLDKSFYLFDFYGNKIISKNNKIEIPLTFKGYFLKTDGSKGSFSKLVKVLKEAEIKGYEPLEIISGDFLERIEQKPVLELKLTNILNKKISGSLEVTIQDLKLDYLKELSFLPHETKIIKVKVINGKSTNENKYSLNVEFKTNDNGKATHQEYLHVNVISKKNIIVDGKLNDWENCLPQIVSSSNQSSLSLTEAAWYPFKQYNSKQSGLASGYMAYDDKHFYFATKVSDNTPHKGTYRFESRPDDDFFYPEISYKADENHFLMKKDGKASAENNNISALQLPDKDGRILNYWEASNNTNSFGLDLNLPEDKATFVSLYFPNIDTWKANIEIYNLNNNELLVSHKIENLWQGTYSTYRLTGKLRIVVHAVDWWYTVKLAGIFFDADPNKPIVRQGAASFIKDDFDTKGKWKNKYGSQGYYIMGLVPKLPPNVTVNASHLEINFPLKWPEGVRRFSYRKDPVTPDNSGLGFSYDNVLIAFNVIPEGEDEMYAYPKGTMPHFVGYKCTDYEYALNKVAEEYGGGTEIWRLLAPGLNRKHFFPRQPKSENEGPVKSGMLSINTDGNTRVTECAIPWEEIPMVKKALDEGKTIKFSFRVNDNGSESMELAKERSVSKKNSRAFHPDWQEHWANEVEFKFEK